MPRHTNATAPRFTVSELLRLQHLRAHLRQRLADGGYPDDLPAEVWRRSEA
ncbi:MAG: hypothetical protein IT307_03575 [Chloroflexi bacterium]|nr:hypothetical protein [Chloroflexota bacterium]